MPSVLDPHAAERDFQFVQHSEKLRALAIVEIHKSLGVEGVDQIEHAGPDFQAFLGQADAAAAPVLGVLDALDPAALHQTIDDSGEICRLSRRNSINSFTVMPVSMTERRASAPSTAHCCVVEPTPRKDRVPILWSRLDA